LPRSVSSFWEERIGSMVAGGGIVWAVAAASDRLRGFEGILSSSGPMEICALGILVWLHAKWRRSTTIK